MFDKVVNVKIEAVSDMLCHNVRLANPSDPYAKAIKEITSIPSKKKTDADYEELARLEFYGGLYMRQVSGNGKPKFECVCPAENIERCLRSGAAKFRGGRDVERGVFIPDTPAIKDDGPSDPDKRWPDERFRLTVPVGNQSNKVMRTRPRFVNWSLEFVLEFDPDVIKNASEIERFLEMSGKLGLNDYRPRYGRFEITKFEKV